MNTLKPQDVFDFWYGDDVAAGSWQAQAGIWFSGNDELDAEIQRRFGDAFTAAAGDELQAWTDSAQGLAALIILLDQFSRNICRGSADAFANDGKALALSQEGVRRGYDKELLPIQRLFLYMPMMHAEDLQVQLEALALFRAVAEEPGEAQSFLLGSVNSAVEHMEIIKQFGRFPHRNVILGRESTPEEVAFLRDGGPNFGQATEVDLSQLEEYADPELYDLEMPDAGAAVPFIGNIAAETGGSVLELGCGTGRFTIPLAQHGVDITGIDISPTMLAHARFKAGDTPIEWIEADARSFELEHRFGLIFDGGETFVHVLERSDHEAILARVREHLDEGGRFVLMTTLFQPARMVDNAEEHDWFSYTDPLGREVRVSGTVRWDYRNQVFHEDAVRRWQDESGEEIVRFAPLARRYFFPQELEALLYYNGFSVLDRYGGWDASPLSADSSVMIFVCEATHEEDVA